MGSMIYLDHAATTPVRPEAITRMAEALQSTWGNPSSAHSAGFAAREAIDLARLQVAKLMGAEPEDIVFTSGGTESDNLAIRGVAMARRERGRHLITSAIEHSAVLNTCRDLEAEGYELTVLGVQPNGLIDLEEFEAALRPDTILVSLMHANNEIGTIQPVEAVGARCRKQGVLFHTDAVQTAGKLPLSFREWPVDLMSVASHKLYGPKGVGALALKPDVAIRAMITGGTHEANRRAGTENVPSLVGFGVAAELAAQELAQEYEREAKLGLRLREGLLSRIRGARLNGDAMRRVQSNVSLTIPDVEGAALLLNLDLAGIAASAGSACRSQSGASSHVMKAIGMEGVEQAGSLRLTVGRLTDEAQIDQAIETISRVVERLQASSEALPNRL